MSLNLLAITDVADVVDEIGDIKAEIGQLEDRHKRLVKILKDGGYERVDGTEYSITITYNIVRDTVNWQKIAIDLGASRQRIAGNTSVSFYDRVLVTARRS